MEQAKKALEMLIETKDNLEIAMNKLKVLNMNLTENLTDITVPRIQLEELASIEFDYINAILRHAYVLGTITKILEGDKDNEN